LRVAVAFDDLKSKGFDDAHALADLQLDTALDQQAVHCLASLPPDSENMEYRTVRIEELTTGMILQEEIRTNIGMLLVGRGQEITYPLAVRLINFHRRKSIKDSVLVLCAKAQAIGQGA
jgi:hypothetical protein